MKKIRAHILDKNVYFSLFFCIATLCIPAYSQTTNSVPLSLITEASSGFLWSSNEGSIPWCSGKYSERFKSSGDSLTFKSSALGGKSSLSEFSGNLEGGSFSLSFEQKNCCFFAGAAGFSTPGDIHIFDGKPRFVLTDGGGSAGFAGLAYRFVPINTKLGIAGVYGRTDWSAGDLYYFYGKPSLPHLWSVSAFASFPADISAHGVFVSADPRVYTNDTVELGSGSFKLSAIHLKKSFPISKSQSFAAGLDYIFTDFTFNFSITNETQTYSLFPYIYLFADATAAYHVIGADIKYAISINHFLLSATAFYLFCIDSQGSAEWNYKYKKNFLYDGSFDSNSKPFPDLKSSSILFGSLSCSYKTDHGFFKITKLFAVPFFTDDLSDDLDYSHRFIESNSSSEDSDSPRANKTLNLLRKYCLSGLSFSLALLL